MRPKDADRMANNMEQSDLVLHCLSRHVCLKHRNITVDHYTTGALYKREEDASFCDHTLKRPVNGYHYAMLSSGTKV